MGKLSLLNNETFEKEVNDKSGVVLIDFYADWCGPCKMMAPVLDELSDELAGKVKIAKVDVDENDELAYKYGIRSIPTLIIFKDGKEAEKIVGFNPKDALKSVLNKYI